MFEIIYIEEEIRENPKVLEIQQKFPKSTFILCESYSEVFNRKTQNFRLQKIKPALILAKKQKNFLQKACGRNACTGGDAVYFSPLLNCTYDCSYCFLQGFYRSAHMVLFVNFEDFKSEIDKALKLNKNPITFCIGYDSDPLALDHIFDLSINFIPFFEEKKLAVLEIRSKSGNITRLREQNPPLNTVVAFSLNPQCIIDAVEKKAPPLPVRLNAIKELQKREWKVGLRFDPIIFSEDFENNYAGFFEEVFSNLESSPHSVTLGTLRFSKTAYKNMTSNSFQERLLAPLKENLNNSFSYDKEIEEKVFSFCQEKLLKYIPKEKLFLCDEY